MGARAFAALPTLQELRSVIPAPVKNFFNMLQDFNFGSNSQTISSNLPGAGKPISTFLDAIWSVLLILFKGVGSIFVWMFHAIANGLESLIFSK